MSSERAQRLRVVFVDHVARLSGGEIAMLRMLPALAAHVDVHVVLGETGPLVARLRDVAIETEVMPLASRLRDVSKDTVRPGRLEMLALGSLGPYVFRLSRRIRILKADLVHTNSLKSALYGGLAARFARVPAVWHIRDRIAADYLPRGAVALVRVAAEMLPTAVIANSQTTLDTLSAVRRRRIVRSHVPDSVPPQRASARYDDDEIVIGVVGRLAPWKGQHVFLDAFAQAFGGTGVRGRIIGGALFGEDAYAASLRQQVERLGITAQIEFRGFRDDIWAELAALDVLVHCSVTPEPFGQVVLEGMAAGVPVVASAAGGPAEIVTNGVDGILTSPGNSQELARTLLRLHNEPDLRARLAGAARRRSREFTPERTAAEVLRVYAAVLGRR